MTDPKKYGRHHQELRKAYKRTVDAGAASCWRCGKPILRGEPWHLGHSDDGSRHMGPEHRSCNLEAQNRLRAADARAWREQSFEDRRMAGYRRILATDPSAYEHPDYPGVIVRDWW